MKCWNVWTRCDKIIDDSWFHQEALSEEEVYRRFVQQ